MKKFLFLIMLCLFCFFSCSKGITDENCLSYQENDFVAEVKGEHSGFVFEAKVSGKRGEGGNTTVVFTAPNSMKNIVAVYESGNTHISLDGIDFSGSVYSNIADFAKLFSLEAVPVSFDLEGENTRAKLTGNGGERYSVLLDRDGLPLEIKEEGKALLTITEYLVK